MFQGVLRGPRRLQPPLSNFQNGWSHFFFRPLHFFCVFLLSFPPDPAFVSCLWPSFSSFSPQIRLSLCFGFTPHPHSPVCPSTSCFSLTRPTPGFGACNSLRALPDPDPMTVSTAQWWWWWGVVSFSYSVTIHLSKHTLGGVSRWSVGETLVGRPDWLVREGRQSERQRSITLVFRFSPTEFSSWTLLLFFFPSFSPILLRGTTSNGNTFLSCLSAVPCLDFSLQTALHAWAEAGRSTNQGEAKNSSSPEERWRNTLHHTETPPTHHKSFSFECHQVLRATETELEYTSHRWLLPREPALNPEHWAAAKVQVKTRTKL